MIRRLKDTAESVSAWIWRNRGKSIWCFSRLPPLRLLGPPMHLTAGIGSERRHGFELSMGEAEQCMLYSHAVSFFPVFAFVCVCMCFFFLLLFSNFSQ